MGVNPYSRSSESSLAGTTPCRDTGTSVYEAMFEKLSTFALCLGGWRRSSIKYYYIVDRGFQDIFSLTALSDVTNYGIRPFDKKFVSD